MAKEEEIQRWVNWHDIIAWNCAQNVSFHPLIKLHTLFAFNKIHSRNAVTSNQLKE